MELLSVYKVTLVPCGTASKAEIAAINSMAEIVVAE
jgi:hypothetical protein